MGLFDALRGHREPPRANLDNLFALSTAGLTLEINLGLVPISRAGVCFRPVEMTSFSAALNDLEHLMEINERSSGTKMRRHTDDMNFEWLILEDDQLEDLVTSAHTANLTLRDEGFGDQLLCSVFGFHPREGGHGPVYLIYAFKRGNFYPFAPTGDRQRDNALEMRLKGSLEKEMPIEPELERWYPVWGVPIAEDH